MSVEKPQFARILKALAPVSVLYHETFMLELLQGFSREYPLKMSYDENDIEAFGRYLTTTSHADRQDLLDLLTLAAKRAELSHGPIPHEDEEIIFENNPPLSSIHLFSNSAFIRSQSPILSLWEAAVKRQVEGELGETFIPNQAEAVLIHRAKSGEVLQHHIRVPFIPLIERLLKGESLASSLEGMTWEDSEIEKQFVRLLGALQGASALVIKD